MHSGLLATRLNLPASRPTFVPRPHLMKKLERGLTCRLMLISAPPGFGKTSLAAEWLRMLGRPYAWLALDDDSNDLALFTTYLASALETLQPGLSQVLSALLNGPQAPPPQAIATLLSNQLSLLEEPVVLALDDYHTINNEQIHTLLRFLIDNQPPRLHLLLLTREDPALPLARLRACSELNEIREADLRFSQAEAAEYLNQYMSLELDRESVTSLTERTEGWIAGLQMAALALQAQSTLPHGSPQAFIKAFRGDDRYVMDYLMDEVFTRQSAEIREFLMCTAVVDRLSAPLCDALLEGAQLGGYTSQALLEILEQRNLFVTPLDNRREWYRYHQLFVDLLRYRLEREQPGRASDLHRLAASWFSQSGYPDEAMKHALEAGDLNLAASLAEQYMLYMTGTSRLGAYLGWLRHLPDELIKKRPYLCAGCAWAYVLTYQMELAVKYLEAGEAALPYYDRVFSVPERRWVSQDEVRGNLEAVHSYASSTLGDASGAIEHAKLAMQMLPPEATAVSAAVALNLGIIYLHTNKSDLARQYLTEAFDKAQSSQSNPYVAISALGLLGSLEFTRGKLSLAEDYFFRAIKYGNTGAGATELPSTGITHGWLVATHYQRNQIDQAQEHMDKVLQAASLFGAPDVKARAYLFQKLLAEARGDLGVAESWQQRAEELLRIHPSREEVRMEAVAFRASLCLAQGDAGAAAQVLATEGLQLHDLDFPHQVNATQIRQPSTRLGCYLLLGRVLMAQGKFSDATALLEQVSLAAQKAPIWDLYLEAQALQSVAICQGQGDTDQALTVLGRALELAADEGYVRPFLSGGGLMLKLLRAAIVRGVRPGFTQKVLAALADQERRSASKTVIEKTASSRDAGQVPEPLTERERQVLRLLATGLTSNQIADELVISVSTARSYIKSLYSKLDAHSREEAIVKSQLYGTL